MLFAALGLFGLAGACGGKTSGTTILGSESHFLVRCSDRCGDGLECIGGICTRSCITGQDSCQELASAAICTNQSVEPGSVAVCDVSCTTRKDCAALGAEHACESGFCRGVSASVPARLACEDYRDQIPPPEAPGVTIVNTGTDRLYLQPHQPPCTPSSLVRVVRLSPEGEATSEVDIHGSRCSPQCQNVMDEGWRLDGEGGELPLECPGFDCVGPPPPTALEPGASLFEDVRTELVPVRLPQACASGIETEFVNCYQRRIPRYIEPGSGSYRIFLDASLTAECGTGCERLRFRLETPNYYGDHVLEISAATGSPIDTP